MQLYNFDDAWLGLGDTSKLHINNEFLDNIKFETLGLDTLRILRQPKNLALAAKVFMDIDVLPIQAAILEELWVRPFPMYIASRGFGKALSPKEFVRVKNGWRMIKDIEVGDYVYGGDGKLAKVVATSGVMHNLNMYKVSFADGRSITCCEDHSWRVYHKYRSKYIVRSTKELAECFREDALLLDMNPPMLEDDEDVDGKRNRFYKYLDEYTSYIDGAYVTNLNYAAKEIIDLGRSIGYDIRVSSNKKIKYIIKVEHNKQVAIKSIEQCGVGDGCCIEVDNADHTYITKDYIITHNSFLLGLYAMLKLLLIPGHKIVIVGAGFRQAKVIYEYMESIWHKADILRSICDSHSGPKRDVDRCTMHINDSWAIASPLGDGCLSRFTVTTYDDGFGYIDENNHNKIYGNSKFRDISDFHDNGVKDTKIVTTKKGYTFEGTHNHKMKVMENGEVVWKRADEMKVGDYILIDRSYRWHNGRFHLDEKIAYQLGIDSFNKEISKDILRADKETMSAYIRGIFDKYAIIKYINGYIYLSLFCKNEKLVRQLQYILLHYKIVCGLKVMSDGWVLDINEEHALLLVQNIGLNDEYKRNMIEYFFDDISIISVNNIYYDVITDIQDGQAHTYDLCVPEDHEYCASGFYSHNTKIRGLRAHTIISDEFNCDRCDTLIETNNGLHRIQDLMNKDDFHVVNKDGDYEKPHNNIITKPCDVYEIKTKYGYTIGCSANHIVMTQNGWKRILELDSNDYIICDNKYKFPDKLVDVVGEDLAWLMGVLIAEGYVNNKNYVTITSTDKDFIDRCVNVTDKIGLNANVYVRDKYTDKRGWKCKVSYSINICNTEFRNKLLELGIGFSTAHQKKIPWSILQSPKNVILSFLSGLFEGDGSCFTFKNKQHDKILAVSYYTVSPVLAQDLQTLLLKLDIVCQRQTRKSKISDNPQWMLRLNGENALNFVNMLNIQVWKDIAKHAYVRVKKDDCGITYSEDTNKYRANLCGLYGKRNIHLGSFDTKEEAIAAMQKLQQESPRGFKVQSVTKLPDKEVLYDFYLPQTHSFYGNGFIQHNSIPPEIYETVVAGFAAVSADPISNVKEAARRKAMIEKGIWTDLAEKKYQDKTGNQAIVSGTAGYGFQSFAQYWKRYKAIIKSQGDENKLKEVFGDEGPPEHFNWRDYSIIRIPYELVPEGFMDDRQISRARATVHSAIYASEYSACIRPDEFVLTNDGCRAIKDIKVGDMVLTHKGRFRRVLKTYSRWFDNSLVEYMTVGSNKYIGATSNHPFYVDGKWVPLGDITEYVNMCPEEGVVATSIITDKRLVPYRGYVHNLEVEDDHSYSLLNASVHNCFIDDSDGFFKRSLIESCVASSKNIGAAGWPKWCPAEFDAILHSNPNKRYVFGVDPASEVDNFSIVVLEIHPEHVRIVCTWSINRKSFKQRVSAGLASENDFYAFCARKIRDLMSVFPCDAIALDAQGGGIAVEEALHDSGKLREGELQIWPVIEDGNPKDTDIQAGLHILHLCQFARADWTAAANHGLRKDLEDKVLLFPRFDPLTIELSIEEDKRRKTAFEKANPNQSFNVYDTLEDCIMELEELKNELCTIVMTRTGTGVGARDRWDTPEIKLQGGKKGRMRKDRYSALVMANMVARSIQRAAPPIEYNMVGGVVGGIDSKQNGQMYVGPDWFSKAMNDGVIFGVNRQR